MKIIKQIKFEGGWGILKARNSFQIQSWTRYLRLTLVFMCSWRYGKSSISIFQVFAGTEKILILGED